MSAGLAALKHHIYKISSNVSFQKQCAGYSHSPRCEQVSSELLSALERVLMKAVGSLFCR